MKNLQIRNFLAFIFLSIFIIACGSDDEPMTGTDAPIASFQIEYSTTDFLEVTFKNFSQNATSYAWDFGDGNGSTEESPVHTYASGGEYTVSLTASSATDSKTTEKLVEIEDPSEVALDLHGGSSKVWKLSRDLENEVFPVLVGPTDRSQIWWALGINDQIGTRPCLMEEEYVFTSDNVYNYVTNGEVFADYNVWNEDAAGNCISDTDAAMMTGPNGEDLSAWGGGSFTYEFDPINSTLTVLGTGAHIGLAKIGTDAEYTTPQEFVRYNVISLETDGPVDKMKLETSIDGGYWEINLVSYDNPADEPELPSALPAVAFGYEITDRTVTFSNSSTVSDSYLWDFGDGNTSTDENPEHTYANDGYYVVTLTGMNNQGSSESSVNFIVSRNSTFTAAELNGGDAKSWKLNPGPSALAVGPSKGSGEYFATGFDDLNTRSCIFDDTYTFNTTNNFDYNANGDVFAESYMGVDPAACTLESDLPTAAMAWGSGNHTFEFTEATGSDPAYLSVTGTGAFIGLPKAFNGGEYEMGPPSPNATVQYEVMNYANSGSAEYLQLTLDISEGSTGGAYWTFILISE